ncbi:hypothetical protein GCM10007967_05420 [Xylanimonas ulmi]|uniref:Putative AbiEi antitoxin of type IV toxin-antitoxin system n=1 Tax=Xylanimonas ulmi TaxID=228973 RepID=A0A4Q7LXT9_9MICO|nr:putative AbiEi antitoxin of type IV toxin-antitoxin system [Xylanibacterium ulmi]
MPDGVVRLASQQEGLVTSRQLAACGVPRQRVADKVAQGTLVRVSRGVFDVELVPVVDRTPHWARAQGWERPGAVVDHLHRRAAILALFERGSAAIAVGLAALALHEVRGLPADFDPAVTIPRRAPRTSPGRGSVRRARRSDDVVIVRGLRAAPLPCAVAQALLELASRPGRRRYAVALLDDVVSRGLIDLDGLREVRRRVWHRPGAAQAREWLDQVNPGSQSPAETWARLSCEDAGCPPDRLQLEVRNHAGILIARVDMAWLLPRGGWLFAEIDGQDVHSTPLAVVRDRTRQNLLADLGAVLRFTGRDAWSGRVADEVARRLTTAGWRPRRPTPPTLHLPH